MFEPVVAQPFISIPVSGFSQAEWQTLKALKSRYVADHDLFDEQERARLEFVRWLYRTGKIQP